VGRTTKEKLNLIGLFLASIVTISKTVETVAAILITKVVENGKSHPRMGQFGGGKDEELSIQHKPVIID
jgi:hypothetical protein